MKALSSIRILSERNGNRCSWCRKPADYRLEYGEGDEMEWAFGCIEHTERENDRDEHPDLSLF